MSTQIDNDSRLESHNRLVERIVNDGVLEDMRREDVAEALGRGVPCGVRRLCLQRGFKSNDWAYDVGRQPGHPKLPAGPLLIVGFDRQGYVDRAYYLVRN